jgi:O-antigen ligase
LKSSHDPSAITITGGILYDSAVEKSKKTGGGRSKPGVRRRIWLFAAGFLLVQIAVLPGAASPFRTPKEVLALIVILIVAGFSLAGQLGRGRVTLRWSPVATLLVALPLIQAISGLWSPSPSLALTAAIHTAIWVGGALFIATADGCERERIVGATAIGAAISCIVLIAQAAGMAVFSLGPEGPSGRLNLTGLTGNPADLSMAAILLLPLILAAPGGNRPRWFRWTLAVLLSLAAIVSQTLTGLVALALLWSTWLYQQRSRRLWIGAAATAFALVAVGLSTGLDTRIQRQLDRLEEGDWYFLLSARSDGWTAAGEMVRTHPISGVGASNFTRAYYPSRVAWIERSSSVGHRSELATHFRFAHCDPLQMTAELGVSGLLWIIAFAVVLVRCRPRGDPLFPLAVAAFVPFALLHFPTHLAVGMVPLTLILGSLLSGAREVVFEPWPWTKRLAAISVTLLVLVGTYWQLHRLMLNLWQGELNYALAVMQTLDEPMRAQQSAAIESQILPRLPALATGSPWLWRMVGHARIARGDDRGAEIAFRNAIAAWPHEEAEFGLGVALAAQDRRLREQGGDLDPRNRRGEAIVHLARVCRTNPALMELIDDPDLRRAVAEIVGAAEGPNPTIR